MSINILKLNNSFLSYSVDIYGFTDNLKSCASKVIKLIRALTMFMLAMSSVDLGTAELST